MKIGLVAAALALLSGCAPGVPVSIANHSSHTLENVVVSGAGFSESAGAIGAGNTETVYVRPKGASSFKIAFDVDGQRYSSRSADPDSENPVSRVAATIDADLSITIETNPQ
jgi:hypothetical protein